MMKFRAYKQDLSWMLRCDYDPLLESVLKLVQADYIFAMRVKKIKGDLFVSYKNTIHISDDLLDLYYDYVSENV